VYHGVVEHEVEISLKEELKMSYLFFPTPKLFDVKYKVRLWIGISESFHYSISRHRSGS
jgi:hypothetical protein